MKKRTLKVTIFLILFVLLGITQVDAIPANSNFEDDIFYEAIIDNLNESKFNMIDDRDYNYEVTQEELESITDLSFGDFEQEEKVENLKGLELLTSLERLSIQYPNIDEIDISHNKELKYISILNANFLDEIDFSQNINLENIDLVYTHLKYLNVQNCTKLKKINMGAGMTDAAKIEKLDVRNCKDLTSLSISGSKLSEVDLSQNAKLEDVLLTNGNIKHIVLPPESSIRRLVLFNNVLESLDDIENLEKMTSLNTLYIQNNNIMDFSLLQDLPNLTEIKTENSIIEKRQNDFNKVNEENLKEDVEELNIKKEELVNKEKIYILFAIVIIIFLFIISVKQKPQRIGGDIENEYDEDTALYGNGEDDENL